MIYIRQGEVTKVLLDVTVNSYADYFLIKFTDPYSQNYKTALFENQAGENCDYLIYIEESEGESLVDGIITLTPRGSWNIDVYAQSSSINLETQEADEFLFTDKLVVIGNNNGDTLQTESGLGLQTESGLDIEVDG
jgi:hypothetical protein